MIESSAPWYGKAMIMDAIAAPRPRGAGSLQRFRRSGRRFIPAAHYPEGGQTMSQSRRTKRSRALKKARRKDGEGDAHAAVAGTGARERQGPSAPRAARLSSPAHARAIPDRVCLDLGSHAEAYVGLLALTDALATSSAFRHRTQIDVYEVRSCYVAQDHRRLFMADEAGC